MTESSSTELEASLRAWFSRHVREPFTLAVERASTGSVNETFLVDLTTSAGTEHLVLKRTSQDGTVLRRPETSEADFLDALHAAGAPVPAVRFRDHETADGALVFAMGRVAGRSVPDDPLSSYTGGGWLLEAPPEVQASVWQTFHEALADVHTIPVAPTTTALGAESHRRHLDYWRRSLLSVADVAAVPLQVAALDWLQDEAPGDVDDHRAICMGDSRLANAIVDGDKVVALIDWELGYVGDPAADIAYSIFTDSVFSQFSGSRLPGFPDADETWDAWERRTGRTAVDRTYWMVHAAIVLSVTATRAIAGMVRAEDPEASVEESMNPFAQLLTDLVPGGLS